MRLVVIAVYTVVHHFDKQPTRVNDIFLET